MLESEFAVGSARDLGERDGIVRPEETDLSARPVDALQKLKHCDHHAAPNCKRSKMHQAARAETRPLLAIELNTSGAKALRAESQFAMPAAPEL
jgi:hypothetical protein